MACWVGIYCFQQGACELLEASFEKKLRKVPNGKNFAGRMESTGQSCVLTAGSDVPNNNLSLAPGTLDPRRPQTNVASLWCFASFASNACRYRARSHLHVHHAVCSAIYLIGFELWLLGWTFGNNVKLFQAWWLVLAANTRPEDARTTCACMQITTISCFRAKLQRHSNHLEGLEKFLMMGFPVDRINIGDLSDRARPACYCASRLTNIQS